MNGRVYMLLTITVLFFRKVEKRQRPVVLETATNPDVLVLELAQVRGYANRLARTQ